MGCYPSSYYTLSLAGLSALVLVAIVQLYARSRRQPWTRAVSTPPKPTASATTPRPVQPIKGREKYRVMMDVRRMEPANWLSLDANYLPEHRVRRQLLAHEKHRVLRCLSESGGACMEVLEEVVGFLCGRFPDAFERTVGRDGKGTCVANKLTGESFVFGTGQDAVEPLEIAVRLTMEDLSVLLENADGEYYLAASASLFPVGWTVEERIGWTISQMHDPVPLWHQQVSSSVSKFLTRLTPQAPMERSTYFIEVRPPRESLLDTLYRPSGLVENGPDPSPHDIIVRREVQTFRRLPRSGAIVFGVKTVLSPLDELPVQELQNLAKEIRSWPDSVGEYRGRPAWGAKALEFCRLRTEAGNWGEKIEV